MFDQEDLRTEYYLWQVHNLVQDISKAEAEVAKDEEKLAGLASTLSKSEAEVSRCSDLEEPLAVCACSSNVMRTTGCRCPALTTTHSKHMQRLR